MLLYDIPKSALQNLTFQKWNIISEAKIAKEGGFVANDITTTEDTSSHSELSYKKNPKNGCKNYRKISVSEPLLQ